MFYKTQDVQHNTKDYQYAYTVFDNTVNSVYIRDGGLFKYFKKGISMLLPYYMFTVVPNIEKSNPRYHENKYFTVTLFLNVFSQDANQHSRSGLQIYAYFLIL